MEAKHTPGPWEVDDIFNNGDLDIVLGYDVPGEGIPILLGTVFFEEDGSLLDRKHATANALLIAAAPDLLAALLDVLEYRGGASSAVEDRYVMNRARAAILKATRGQS